MAKTQPISVRLGRAAELLVADEMRRTGRSRSAIVGELTEEAAKMRLFPGIGFREGPPRRAWVIGTGLDVWEIVELHRDYEGDVSRIVENHQSLSERAIHLAIAYAERFPEEIQERLDANATPFDELLRLYPFIRHENV
jgi:uncharacterized protein (DUF433 family)